MSSQLGSASALRSLADALEQREQVDQRARVVVGARAVAERELVGLPLVVAAVLEEQEREAGLRQARQAGDLRRQHRADAEPDLRQHPLAHLVHAVARGDVADLVPEHARELRLVAHVGEDAAGDVDEAARQRERVHHVVVDDAEGPRQVGPLRLGGEPAADRRHVLLDLAVVVEAELLRDLRVGLLPHRDLLLLAHQGELALAGGRVDAAAGDEGGGGDEGDARARPPTLDRLSRRGVARHMDGSFPLGGRV